MKKLLVFLIISFALLEIGHTQNRYHSLNNRVLLSGVVNQDTFLVENTKNQVAIDGELGLLKIIFSNKDSRRVSENFTHYTEKRGDIVIEFGNEYMWIDDRFKSSEPVISFQEEIRITINDHEEIIVANFTISKFAGKQDMTSMLEISGSFPANNYNFDTPNFHFKEDVSFIIQITVQVVQ